MIEVHNNIVPDGDPKRDCGTGVACDAGLDGHTNKCITHLIHMLAKQLTPIKAKRTLAGFVPAILRTLVMISLSMLVLLKAEEIVNPPIKSMIVGEKMTEKTNLVASCVDSLCPSVRMTRRTTRRKGTAREVTNKGMACGGIIFGVQRLRNTEEDLPQMPRKSCKILKLRNSCLQQCPLL